jgi:hypothetical protein
MAKRMEIIGLALVITDTDTSKTLFDATASLNQPFTVASIKSFFRQNLG